MAIMPMMILPVVNSLVDLMMPSNLLSCGLIVSYLVGFQKLDWKDGDSESKIRKASGEKLSSITRFGAIVLFGVVYFKI